MGDRNLEVVDLGQSATCLGKACAQRLREAGGSLLVKSEVFGSDFTAGA